MIEVILAGGLGTRFWPMSRRDRPKQFLELDGERSMLERTVERLRSSPVHEHIVVLVDREHLETARALVPEADDLEYLIQPSMRETAPAVALSVLHSEMQFDDAPVGIFPADHVVEHPERFHRALADAERLAREGGIVTFGIEPTRAETGYGYIRRTNEPLGDSEREHRVYPVESFVEKPDRSTAQRYLESGDYLWNAGMSVFRPSVLFEEMRRQMSGSHARLEALREGLEHDNPERIAESYESMEAVSLDRGVLESADDLYVLGLDVGWSDIGHWAALSELGEADGEGNVIQGEGMLLESREATIVSEATDRTVVGVDLEDLVVVDMPDAVLVVPRHRAQRVRKVVDRLEGEGRDEVL